MLPDTGSPILIVYGVAAADSFVGEDYLERPLDAAMWYELHDAGYECIVFGTVNDQVYFRDDETRRKIAGRAENDAAPLPAAGPLSPARLGAGRTAATGPDQAIGRTLRAGDTISDIETFKIIAALLLDNRMRTAVVILGAETFLDNVATGTIDKRREADATFEKLITSSAGNDNVLVLVFYSATAEQVLESVELLGSLFRYLDDKNGHQVGKAMRWMSFPDAEEIERIICLRHHGEPELRVASWSGLPQVLASMESQPKRASEWIKELRLLARTGKEAPLSAAVLREKGFIDAIPGGKSAQDRLAEMPGLEGVKDFMRQVVGRGRVQATRRQRNLSPMPNPLNLVFTGSPGTGKTTVARLIGEIYRDEGLLKRGHVVEVTGASLVGQYIGQTPVKVNEKIDEAMDGVLFIDEAYGLIEGGNHDFGIDGANTLVTRLENERDRFAVVIAGYQDRIEVFLQCNQGLPGRFQKRIDFPNYTQDQLLKILRLELAGQDLTVDPALDAQLGRIVAALAANPRPDFQNARAMRHLADELYGRWSMRVSPERGDSDIDEPLRVADVPAEYRAYLTGSLD